MYSGYRGEPSLFFGLACFAWYSGWFDEVEAREGILTLPSMNSTTDKKWCFTVS